MKYSLECQVLSNIFTGQTIKIIEAEKEFTFKPNEKGILSKIQITKRITNTENLLPEIKRKENSPMHIVLNEDPILRKEIISDFQYLEGHIGLIANLTKIFWNEPSVEWIPETEEEKNRLQVFSAHFGREFSNQPSKFNIDIVKSIIKNKPNRDSLTALMAFYRDGKAFFDNLKFVNAFYDFYYIIEDLYGNCAWRNQEVERNFKSSIELQDTIQWVLSSLIDSSDKHKREITALLQQKSLPYDVEGVIVLLVKMRGHLHHFSRRNASTQNPNPLAEENYEGFAFLSMAIAMQSILKEIKKTEH